MKKAIKITITILAFIISINVFAINKTPINILEIDNILGDSSTKTPHELNEEITDRTITFGDDYSNEFTIKDEETDLSYSSSNEDVASFSNEGNILINGAGQTTITITAPETDNYSETTWNYNLTVNIRKLTKPTLKGQTVYAYDEATKTLNPTNFDNKYMNIEGNSTSSAGKHTIKISLKNPNGCTWTDNTTNNITFNWEIYKIDTAMYRITSALSSSKVIDVNGRSSANKANIQLYQSNNGTAQRFLIKYVSKGYYKIENAYSIKVLDVANGKAINGNNVWQYSYNGSNAQLWRIQRNNDGTYTFISKLGNFALDIKAAKTANKTNIQIYKSNGSKAQRFILAKDNYLTATQPLVNNRSYTIATSLAPNQVLDIAGGKTTNKINIQLYKSNNTLAQKYKITHVRDGYYKIINVKSRKALDVKGASPYNKANVWQYTYNGSSAQLWKIQKNSDGTYTFISRCNGKVLDVAGAKTTNGTNIQVYSSNGSKAQKFILNIKQFIGIDVSAYQGNINWEKVKNNVDFVIIRAGLYDEIKDSNGNDKYQDSKLFRNVEACEKYKIPYSLYLYSAAVKVTDADTFYNTGPGGSGQSEAQHMNKILNMLAKKGYRPTMPTQVWLDVEEKKKCIDILTKAGIKGEERKKLMANIINRFCTDIKKNGYTCGFYSSTEFIKSYINAKTVINNGNTLWLAHWTYDITYPSYYDLTNYVLWQYSNEGSISGITGRVDMNTTDNIVK